MRFELDIPIGKKRPERPNQIWISNTLGATGYIDWKKGSIILTQLRYAVQESRFGGTLCFANHLQAELGKDPQITNRSMITASGQEIPEPCMKEVRQESSNLTYPLSWQKHDLVMIDNRRLMHGRTAFQQDEPRDIVIVQTARANFPFGATTRKKSKPHKNDREN